MEVSLVFLGDRAMRAVNKKWHKHDAQSNVLAFRLDQSIGEIFINPYQAQREARMHGVSQTARTVYLFVHGLLHIYGYDHHTKQGAFEMNQREDTILKTATYKQQS